MMLHLSKWLRLGQIAILAFLVSACTVSANELTTDADSVDARLAQDARYLSSDELEGRGPGTEGIDVAAEYIADQFREMGLITELFDGSPYQPFTIPTDFAVGDVEKNRLTLVGPATDDGDAQNVELLLGEAFNPMAVGSNGAFSGELVFVGYGISAEEHDYDDYEGIDVEGKVVLMLRREPEQNNSESVFDGTDSSSYAYFVNKVATAAEHGAVAIVIVNDYLSISQEKSEAEKTWHEAVDALADEQSRFASIDNPTDEQFTEHRAAVHEQVETIQEMEALFSEGFDQVLNVTDAGKPTHGSQIPVYFASRDAVDPIVQSALHTSLAALEEAIDDGLTPHSQSVSGWSAEGETLITRQQVTVKNVVAVLEGEGPLADETVVIGAHYDHLGYGSSSSLSPWTRAIHNGADDNASGTTALMEVARQLAARDTPPARRIVFIAFTGEERGLLGSAHYCRSPRFPLEETVAMLNLDMVGRLGEDAELTIYGTGTAESFDTLVDRLGEEHHFSVSKISSGFGPSDHASFYAKKIPVLFFFTGLHTDYHRPSDDFEKLDIGGMRRIVSLVVDTAITIIETEERPAYLATRRSRETPSDNPRPYFGSIPDYSQEVEGLGITDVAEDGPADKAGLEADDIIIRFGDAPISGIEDFDAALRQHEAGDEVEFIVLRDGERVTLTVTLGDPR